MHEPHPWLHCRCQKVQLWQLLWAVAAGNVEKRPVIGKQLQILPSFYFPQYSDSPVFTLSVSQPFVSLFFSPKSLSLILLISSLLLFYPFVPSSPSQLCASDYRPLNSQHKQCLCCSSQLIGASDWIYNGLFVCVFISVFTIRPGIEIRSFNWKLYLIFFFFVCVCVYFCFWVPSFFSGLAVKQKWEAG